MLETKRHIGEATLGSTPAVALKQARDQVFENSDREQLHWHISGYGKQMGGAWLGPSKPGQSAIVV